MKRHTVAPGKNPLLMPQVKIVMPDAASRLQLLEKGILKIFDKYFQEEFDFSMNRQVSSRKSNALSITLFDDFSSKKDPLENPHAQQMGWIQEIIKVLIEVKSLFEEIRVKDELLRQQKPTFLSSHMESEIGKLGVREFENAQVGIRYLQAENSAIKAKNLNLEQEIQLYKAQLDK